MKIVEVKAEEFDRYVVTEPDYNIYHTGQWHELFNNPKSEYLYLTYQDDMGFIYGFALTEINRKNVFSKLQAFISHGYLTNFYDHKLLKSFNNDLISFLKERKVKTLSISPVVPFTTRFGTNEYLIEKLEELGYKRNNETFMYSRELEESDNENDDRFVISFSELDDLSVIEKQFGYSLNSSKECFKDKMHVLVSCLNIDESLENFLTAVKNNPADVNSSNILNRLQSLKENNGDTIILEYICYLSAGKKAYVLYTDEKESELDINSNIWSNTSALLKEKGFNEFTSIKHFKGSNEIRRIGEFETSI